MIRGINKQTIFYEREEYRKFQYILKDCKEKYPIKIHAYCIMDNHVHLLIEVDCNNTISDVMHYIEVRFVGWYNKKYERVGHLFQNRFLSKTVEDESYFLATIRYILNNPVKAGIVEKPFSYTWSSACEYINGHGEISDIELAMYIWGSRANMLDFLLKYKTEGDEEFLDAYDEKMVEDKTMEYAEKMLLLLGYTNMYEIQNLKRKERDEKIKILIDAGFSQRTICRLCGFSKGTVSRAASL